MSSVVHRHGLVMAVGLLAVCIGASCASRLRPLPWMEGGERVGTIYRTRDAGGTLYHYRDPSRRLIRKKRFLPNGHIDPSFAVENYTYDEAGRQASMSFTTSQGESTLGPPGFATSRTRHRCDESGCLADVRYFDPQDAPMLLPEGFHQQEVWTTADGEVVTRRRFYDLAGQPAGVAVGPVKDASEVRYKWLKGVTPLRYESYYNVEGEQVLKRRTSGRTSWEEVEYEAIRR